MSHLHSTESNSTLPVEQLETGLIEVIVKGAVRRPGRYVIASPTVAAALMAAGGVAQTRRMWASGAMSIRRPQPGAEEQICHFDMSTHSAADWGRHVLRAGDVVELQWQIKED